MYNYPPITHKLLSDILRNRFSAEGLLSLKDLPNPSQFKDMDRATKRIYKAIKDNEKIVIIGDYDVDGVVSTTLMKLFFEEAEVDIEWIIPNRFTDGYGLSERIIPRVEGCSLAITVDNGISAVDAAKMCQERGIDLIITDHHIPPQETPQAYAIINQKQESCSFPYGDLCGAQIAWYLIASLKNYLKIDIDIRSYLDLVSIAIIADMMPLKHINRAMVISGVNMLNKTDRPAIRAFREHLDKESFSGDDVGFLLAPILNSAGRMEDASDAVNFLISKNIYEARVGLEKLVGFNSRRKEIEQEITEQATTQAKNDDDILVLYGEDWHEGVVGIVAARISRAFEKPTIVLSRGENGLLKGSGRSYGECDLFKAVNSSQEYLHKFGGHRAAIGLSIFEKNINNFKSKLQQYYRLEGYEKDDFDPDIVGEISFTDISFDLTNMIKTYEPFGQDNKKPKFITTKARVIQAQTMGKKSEHLRFVLEQKGVIFTAVKFKSSDKITEGETVTIVYTINENYFRGKTSLQLLIETIKKFNS